MAVVGSVRFQCRKCSRSTSAVEGTNRWKMRLCENCFGLNMKSASGTVYNVNYHFVWCTKYRRKVLDGDVANRCWQVFWEIAEKHGWEIVSCEIRLDHVHMFVSAPPSIQPSDIVRYFKGASARLLFQEFPELKRQLWGGHLWAPSYYVGTAGNISAEAIKNYIEETKNL